MQLPETRPVYLTPEEPCSYLPERLERKLLFPLEPPNLRRDFDGLSRSGWRRSGSWAYRTACRSCRLCIPVRLRVAALEPSRSQARTLRANRDLSVEWIPPVATTELWTLFHRYVVARHGGSMAEMDRGDFEEMIEGSPVETAVAAWRDSAGRLLAAALVDQVSDGFSAVYSFWEIDEGRRGLGTQVVLSMAKEAHRLGLPFLYLGFWIAGSETMDYKARFRPLEAWDGEAWREFRREE